MEIAKIPNDDVTLVLALDRSEQKLLKRFAEISQEPQIMGLMNEVYGSTEDAAQLGVMMQQIERFLDHVHELR